MLAEINIPPGAILAWLAVGLIAGWLVARVMKVGGFGQIGYITLAIIGAVIGGLAFKLIVTGEAGFLGSIVVALLGAHLFIAAFRFMGFKRRDS